MEGERDLRWDITAEKGTQGEMFVKDILRSLRAGSVDVEVKRDEQSRNTGNFYLEYESWNRTAGCYKRSGIATTQATAWAIVLEQDHLVVFITTERLKELGRLAFKKPGRRKELTEGKNPTKGVLIPLPEMVSAGTRVMRAKVERDAA